MRGSTKGRAHLRLAGSNAEVPQPKAPTLGDADDAQLLEALRTLDPRAATALHDRARPVIDRTLSRLLGRGDTDYEDVAQLVLIELVTTIGRFRGECPLDGWISMISARVVYKHIRRRKTERKIFGAVAAETLAEPRSNHGRDGLFRSVLARVRQHLDALDPSKAWTFILHDVCGYDLRETAQITGVTVAAAQTRLTRGRRELHDRMAADPELSHWIEDTGGIV